MKATKASPAFFPDFGLPSPSQEDKIWIPCNIFIILSGSDSSRCSRSSKSINKSLLMEILLKEEVNPSNCRRISFLIAGHGGFGCCGNASWAGGSELASSPGSGSDSKHRARDRQSEEFRLLGDLVSHCRDDGPACSTARPRRCGFCCLRLASQGPRGSPTFFRRCHRHRMSYIHRRGNIS